MGLINTLWCLQFPFQFLYSASCFCLSTGAAGFKFQQVLCPEHFRIPSPLPPACNPVGFAALPRDLLSYMVHQEIWGQRLLFPFSKLQCFPGNLKWSALRVERYLRFSTKGWPRRGPLLSAPCVESVLNSISLCVSQTEIPFACLLACHVSHILCCSSLLVLCAFLVSWSRL